MLDRLFFVSLILSVTGLFRFIAPSLGVTISAVSFALLAFNIFYLIINLGLIKKLIKNIWPWIFLLLIWPLVTILYSPGFDLRLIGVLLSNFVLFVGGAVFFMSVGKKTTGKLFQISFALTIFGLVLNMILPDLFLTVGNLASARTFTMNRPGGFHLQPNGLAVGICFVFMGWHIFSSEKTPFVEATSMVLLMTMLILTGSRTGMVLGALIIVIHYSYQWYSSLTPSKQGFYFGKRMSVLLVFIFAGIVSLKAFTQVYAQYLDVKTDGIIDRINNVLEFRLTNEGPSVLEDSSVLDRWAAQKIYLDLIAEKPLVGHGFGAETNYLDYGVLYKSSHSTILSLAMAYGVFYPLFYLVLIFKLIFHRNRKWIEKQSGTNMIIQLVAISAVLFLYSSNVLERRSYMVILGAMIVLINYPSLWSNDRNRNRSIVYH